MKINTKTQEHLEVDRGLIAMYLKMSPAERLRTNDNAMRAILELRNAYIQRKANSGRPKCNT